jgi:predicted dehydrogenase
LGGALSLRVLIVGCGRIAGGGGPDPQGRILTHAAAYRDVPGFEIVACVDPDSAARQRFMEAWNVERGYAALAEAIGDGLKFDVASICTPTACHADNLELLVRIGLKAVFCEKPLTGDPHISETLASRFDAARTILAVNHQRRWAPGIARLREDLNGGGWGEIRAMCGVYNKGIVNNGSHMLDLVDFLAGPATLLSVGPARKDGPEDPTVDAMLQLRSGGVVHLIGADARDYARFDLEIVAEKGSVRIFDLGFRIEERRAITSAVFSGYSELGPSEISPSGLDCAMKHAVAEIASAIAGGPPPRSTARTAITSEAMCVRILALAA